MTAAYDVRVASAARRQLSRLPARSAVAVVAFITTVLPQNPLRLSKSSPAFLASFRVW